MEMNRNIAKGHWLEFKGEIQKAWGKLTDDDLEKSKGDLKVIRGLIQQRYGEAQANYDDKLTKIFSRFEEKKSDVVEDTRTKMSS